MAGWPWEGRCGGHELAVAGWPWGGRCGSPKNPILSPPKEPHTVPISRHTEPHPLFPPSLVSLVRLIPRSFFLNTNAWTTVIVAQTVTYGFPCGGLAVGGKMWLAADSMWDWKDVVFHELYHLIDQADNNVNDRYDRVWRSFNPPDFKYLNERRKRQVNHNLSYTKAPAGFACGYGTTNCREDKATVMAFWMTQRGKFRKRGQIGDKILMNKVRILEQELDRFFPSLRHMIKANG